MATVLIVDDSELVLDMARSVLEDAGYRVLTLESPFAFSQTVQAEKPDLIMIDVNMPGLAGDTLVAITKKHKLHRCPILLYSDRPALELDALAMRVGAQGFVQKSGGSSALLASVRKYVAA